MHVSSTMIHTWNRTWFSHSVARRRLCNYEW